MFFCFFFTKRKYMDNKKTGRNRKTGRKSGRNGKTGRNRTVKCRALHYGGHSLMPRLDKRPLPNINVTKKSWPQHTGRPVRDVVRDIKKENPNLSVQMLREGSMVTRDVRHNRVRVYYKRGRVVGVPTVG